LKSLVDSINEYNGTDEAANRLRDLVCYISDRKELRSDPLYRIALFDAAQVMRTFGYNVQNQISVDEACGNFGLNDIRQQTVQRFYASNVYPNNLIDKRQKEVIDFFNSLKVKRLIVSAPTSFGKTFILREILFSNRDRYNNILLVFPTVALLNENSLVIHDLIKSLHLDYTVINNVYSKIDADKRNIYILTPERTLKLLSDYNNLNIDFFFFDEVYKIDEDLNRDEDSAESDNDELNDISLRDDHGGSNRAKAFRIALYLLSKNIKEYYIAGPYLNLNNVRPGFQQYLIRNNVEKMQIEFEPTLRIEVEAWGKKGKEIDPIKHEEIPIHFDYDKYNNTESKVRGIISYLRRNNMGQAIFYCATPGKSMNYAKGLVDKAEPDPKRINKYRNFIQHLQRRYGIRHTYRGKQILTSDYWGLIAALSAGFGIHHGKFPKYIQREILKIFNAGDIDYLFCTSTIIEGVNTNAKNVVIINNAVGGRIMTAFSLKNIRGRAGRYYHHFIGRVFYTDKRQREIERLEDIQLDFSIYNNRSITKVDCDNSEINDLSESNKVIKQARENTFNKERLPDEVFIKNRLYPRDIQEGFLKYLRTNIKHLVPLISQPGNIPFFLKNNMMSDILESLTEVGIIDSKTKTAYWAISDTYSKKHFEGLLKYQFQKDGLKDPEKEIDRAYLTVFTQIRNTIEYEIPRLLSLFESIFKQAATLEGYDVQSFDMSSIIRYFELGVRTMFGTHLVEYGFPVDAIRDIETSMPELSQMELPESIEFVRDNISRLSRVLDEYEKGLLRTSIETAIL